MRVSPGEQRQGFGQTILFLLLQRAVEMCYSKVVLNTTDKQVAAQQLYLKNGFEETHREELRGFEIIHYVRRL